MHMVFTRMHGSIGTPPIFNAFTLHLQDEQVSTALRRLVVMEAVLESSNLTFARRALRP